MLEAEGTASRRRLGRGLLVSGITLLVLALGAEWVFRGLASPESRSRAEDARAYWLDGRVKGFVGHPHTAFRRPMGASVPGFNTHGFHDREWAVDRDPDVVRILCLGGSTTEGGADGSGVDAFPRQLELYLNHVTERRFEVFNCGISGWTTAETLVAYFLLLQDFRPDVVILHHAVNDVAARLGAEFRPDYGHFRKVWETPRLGSLDRLLTRHSDLYLWLRRGRGELPHIGDLISRSPQPGAGLVPETRSSFVRNIQTVADHARGRGALVVLATMPLSPEVVAERPNNVHAQGAREHNELLRGLVAENGYLLCDLEQIALRDPVTWGPQFADLVHLSSQGNVLKTRALAELLLAQDGLLER